MTKILIATNREGLARAISGGNGSRSRVLPREWTTESGLKGHDLRCLAVDPLNANVIYAGTQEEGVLRSADKGQTWQPAGLAERPI